MKLSKDLKNSLINEGIDPEGVLSVSSRYEKSSDSIIMKVSCKDGSEKKVITKSAMFASRKNKRW